MSKAKVGVVAVASHAESGGERAEEMLEKAKGKLENRGLKVATGKKVVWDSADAIQVAEQLAQEELDLLVIIHTTWVSDTVQYILVNTIKIPAVLDFKHSF